MKFSFRGVYKLEGVRLTINLLHKHLNKKSQRSIQQGNHICIVRKSRQRGSSERRSNICGAVVADKSTGLSNRRSNPQSVCQWTHISWSYIYIYSIYFLPIDTLCTYMVYLCTYLQLLLRLDLHGFSGCVLHLISSLSSASFFLLFFSPLFSVWGHSVRFSAAYLNS